MVMLGGHPLRHALLIYKDFLAFLIFRVQMRVQSNVPSPSAWEPHYLSRQAQLARSLRSLFYSPVATCNLLCGNAPSSYPHRWHAGRRIKGAFINDQAIFDGNCSVVRRRYGGLGLARIANRAAAEPIRPDLGGAKKQA